MKCDVFSLDTGPEIWVATTNYWYGGEYFATLPSGDYLWSSSLDGKLRSLIKSQNLNLAQTLAEYRRTSSMFSSLAMDVVKTFRSLRSGRGFSDFVRILQRPKSSNEVAVANRWLQYQYGLKPVMSDLYGATDALATGIRSGIPRRVQVGKQSYISKSELHTAGSAQCIRTAIHQQSVRSIAYYRISDPALKQLAQIGITNPALLLWELIPYSFVIDWLIPVGDFLSSLDALNGTSDLVVIGTRKTTYTSSSVGNRGTITFKRMTTDRSVPRTSLSLPKLSYQPSKSLTAVANGLALLTQLKGGNRTGYR